MSRYLIGAQVLATSPPEQGGGDVTTLPAMLAGHGPLVTGALVLGMLASVATIIEFMMGRRR